MSRNVAAVAMLTVLIGAATPALAASTAPGAAARPPVTIRPPAVRPSIQPRVHIPSISNQVGTQVQNDGQLAKNKKKGGKNTTKNQEQYLQIEMKDAIITGY